MTAVNECFGKIKSYCFKYIKSQETNTEKFKNKDKMIKSFLIPLCFWISKRKGNKKSLILGIAGGQGAGKTTIASIISIILKKYFKLIYGSSFSKRPYKKKQRACWKSSWRNGQLFLVTNPG